MRGRNRASGMLEGGGPLSIRIIEAKVEGYRRAAGAACGQFVQVWRRLNCFNGLGAKTCRE